MDTFFHFYGKNVFLFYERISSSKEDNINQNLKSYKKGTKLFMNNINDLKKYLSKVLFFKVIEQERKRGKKKRNLEITE